MDKVVLPLNTNLAPPCDSYMEFDHMDELLLGGGSWLDGSEFSHYDASSPIGPFDPSFLWPNLEARNIESYLSPSKCTSQETQKSTCRDNVSIIPSKSNPLINANDHGFEVSGRGLGRRTSISTIDRLVWAIGYIKDYLADKEVLIQVWVPVNRGGLRVLATYDQPFSLDLNCPRLSHYREISMSYNFVVEDANKGLVGLPGRVYLGKVPEWSPDVRFFTRDEYQRVGHAQQYDVRGSFAVPILEQGSRNCLGVIEVILTKAKITYGLEIQSVCKALEAVDLKTCEVQVARNIKTCDSSYQAALPEILEVLRCACETHRLPLAQTWVPCVLQGKGGSRHSDENLLDCVSTVDSACYVTDPSNRDFHQACSEHHLLKGQGIVGRAFGTNQPCFSSDVTSYTKTDYPLSHHAKMFGLCAAIAIRLRSIHTSSADCVLEFFLPKDCRDPEKQKEMIHSLFNIIQKVCRTLDLVMDEELHNEVASSLRSRRDSSSIVGFAENSSLSMSKTGGRRRRKNEKTVSLQDLQQYFPGSLKDAAKSIGVCPTTLKRICRKRGIMRWPSRQIKKVSHSLEKIQRVIDSVPGSSALPIDTLYSNFPLLSLPNTTTQMPFSKDDISSKSTSTSCSRNSASSQCYSSTTLTAESPPPPPLNRRQPQEGDILRVKVIYGQERIRFRLQNNCGYENLLNQIAMRFGIDDTNGFHLNYLDDDSEWVLLTCDADLEECVDAYRRSSQSRTIKISLLRDSRPVQNGPPQA